MPPAPSAVEFRSETVDRLARWPVGLESRFITRMGSSETTRRRHLPDPLPRSALQAGARLQVLCTEGARGAGGERQTGLPGRLSSMIVDARHRHLGVGRTRVGQPQQAHLIAVPGRVEDRNRMAIRRSCHLIVQTGQKAVPGTHVSEGLDLVAPHFKAPITLPVSDSAQQPLGCVTFFDVPRIEMYRCARCEREGWRHAAWPRRRSHRCAPRRRVPPLTMRTNPCRPIHGPRVRTGARPPPELRHRRSGRAPSHRRSRPPPARPSSGALNVTDRASCGSTSASSLGEQVDARVRGSGRYRQPAGSGITVVGGPRLPTGGVTV